MGEPFNVKARNAALDLWNVDGGILHKASRIHDILMNGDMGEYDEVRALIFDLQVFADGLNSATDTLGEEDS